MLQNIGANLSIEVHYLHRHLDEFPDNCSDMSDGQGERFYEDIKNNGRALTGTVRQTNDG